MSGFVDSDLELLNAGQVAELLGVTKSWVYAETRAGRLPHVVMGRYRRYRRSGIAAFVARNERGPLPRTGRFDRPVDRSGQT